jgi:hypothetical protein
MLRELSMTITGRSPSGSTPGSGPSPASVSVPGSAPIVGPHPAGSSPAPVPAATAAPADIVYGPDVSINGATVTDDPDDPDDDAAPAFEGDSSMAAQTAFASEFLEHTVTRTLLSAAPPSSGGPHPQHHQLPGQQPQLQHLDLDPDMQSALAALQQMARLMRSQSRALHRPDGAERETRFPHAKPLPPTQVGPGGKKSGGLRALPMPPAHVVVALLRELKEVPLTSFAGICIFVATENFAERCRRVYFATDDYSLMTWGVVNAGLYFLLQEKASLAGDAAQQAQLLEYQALCRDNLETALANLPLLLPARRESIEVLLLGVCRFLCFSLCL